MTKRPPEWVYYTCGLSQYIQINIHEFWNSWTIFSWIKFLIMELYCCYLYLIGKMKTKFLHSLLKNRRLSLETLICIEEPKSTKRAWILKFFFFLSIFSTKNWLATQKVGSSSLDHDFLITTRIVMLKIDNWWMEYSARSRWWLM